MWPAALLVLAAAGLSAPLSPAWAAPPAEPPSGQTPGVGTATPAKSAAVLRFADAEACVEAALKRSTKVEAAHARVAQLRGRMAQVESLYYPKLSALGFVAPMYTVQGSGLSPQVQTNWRKLSDWGPYARVQAVLAWPLYTFGRIEAGVDAARARADLEAARARAVQDAVAFEVRRLWATRAWLLGMQPFLRSGAKQIAAAVEKATEAVAEADGSMTAVDVARLRFAAVELKRLQRQNTDGVALVEAGLKLAMGLPEGAAVRFADARLKRPGPKLPTLQQALALAAKHRPEWAQVKAGRAAAGALVRVARLTNAPAVILGGGLSAAWTPTRTASTNPYHRDPFNGLAGGVALALQWTFDPARTAAQLRVAKARTQEVEAVARYAASGIPTDVLRAWQAAKRGCELAQAAREGVKVTRQWQRSAASAFRMGTSGSRDLLEGTLAAGYARTSASRHLRDCYVSYAELQRAVGTSRLAP